KRINHPREVLTVGQVLEVKVDSIDSENKRLSLTLSAAESTEEQQDQEEDLKKYLRPAPSSMGTLADKFKIRQNDGKKR
ncbi:MAG: hypothetical protein AAGU11_18570, partial [Syntrophobacteraceae bacterium]